MSVNRDQESVMRMAELILSVEKIGGDHAASSSALKISQTFLVSNGFRNK